MMSLTWLYIETIYYGMINECARIIDDDDDLQLHRAPFAV